MHILVGSVYLYCYCGALTIVFNMLSNYEISAKSVYEYVFVFVFVLHLCYICGAVSIVFIMLTNHGSWAKPVWLR